MRSRDCALPTRDLARNQGLQKVSRNRSSTPKVQSSPTLMKSKRGQVTLFIIIAIILVAGIAVFFMIREGIIFRGLPANIEPAYNAFLVCLEEDIEVGISILESQGGYIELPDFEPGSSHMPFSSQLNFLGNPIPYWYYVSGNGIEKEQVVSKKEMEEQMRNFIEERARNCNLESYYDEGFEIEFGEPRADVNIRDNAVDVKVDMRMNIQKGEDHAAISNHKVSVKSKLGALYDSAKEIYSKEQKDLFLEEYAVDFLRLYAPVDGVEITCSPKIWNADEVFDSLEEAIEINTFAMRTGRGSGEDKYFVVDLNVNEEVRFINSQNWPSSFEVLPSEGNLLLANPVGNQPGLGVLGFCYVPYHFVYNVKYPVLIQVSSGSETFQFPMAVVIQGNNPREALDVGAGKIEVELCEYMNTEILVRTYDTSLNSVDAQISYECFGEKCNIGTSSGGLLEGKFPQCANGEVIARAEGYEETKYEVSTINGGSVDVILNKLYEVDVDLKLDGVDYGGDAIIYFISQADDPDETFGKGTKTVVYPEQNSVELAEGGYEIQVYIYEDSSLEFESTTTEQCVEVMGTGLKGLLGLKETECFDIEIPDQIISNVLSGGGKQEYYILESQLAGVGRIEIDADSLPIPKTLEELQNNHLLFEGKNLEVSF